MITQKITQDKIKPRFLLYGEAGAGKTHLLRDFPKPLLIFDFDQKLQPLAGVDGIEVVSYSVAEPTECRKVLSQFWKDYKEAKSDPQWATLAVDSITSLSTILLRAKMIQAGKEADAKPTLPVYGDVKSWYQTFFGSLKTVTDKVIVVLAHEKYVIDEDSSVHSIRPNLIGSMSEEVSSIFTDTLYLEVKERKGEVKRVLHTQKFKKYIIASVSLGDTSSIEDPTYNKIQQVVVGK